MLDLCHVCGFALANAGHDHASAASLARTQEHPAHGQVHRAGARSVQGLLASVTALSFLLEAREGMRAAIWYSSGSSATSAAIRRAYAIPNFFDTCAGV
jgi:acetylornithine/succinyldiaminopimelate/putrescine aminotransferase